MSAVSASVVLPASVHDAESLWYDTDLWPGWVDGLQDVLAVQGEWPQSGAVVVWVSGPAGRGQVTERVLSYEQLHGQTLEVDDDAVHGVQMVSFTPLDDGVEVNLRLEYRIKKRSLVTPSDAPALP